LLAALRLSGSLPLLRELWPVLREDAHVHAAAVDDALAEYVARLDEKRARVAFDACLATALDATSAASLRLALTRKLCVPLLSRCSREGQIDAFITHADALITLATKELAPLAGLSLTVTLKSKMCAFLVLAALYRRVTKRAIDERVVPAYQHGDEKRKLNSQVMRSAHAALYERVSTSGDGAPTHTETVEYRGVIYDALAAVLTRTQSEVKMFEVMCFKSARATDTKPAQMPFESIVDTSTEMHFGVETNFAYRTWRQLVAADAADASAVGLRRSPLAAAANTTRSRTDARYISTAYLATTSLSHDLSQMGGFMGLNDVSVDDARAKADSVAAAAAAAAADAASGASGAATAADATAENDVTAKTLASADEKFELDEFNRNVAMLPLLRLIDFVHARFDQPAPVPATSTPAPRAMPAWMAHMLDKFADGAGTHANVRMFLVKVVLNRRHLFAEFGARWLRPLLATAVDERCFNRRTKGLNYMLRDLAFLFVEWAPHTMPRTDDERARANEFVSALMCEAHAERPSVIRGNVKLLKELFKEWHGIITPPRDVVMTYLRTQMPTTSAAGVVGAPQLPTQSIGLLKTKRTRLIGTGLQLLSILIAHDCEWVRVDERCSVVTVACR
jgi:hypothetical protein